MVSTSREQILQGQAMTDYRLIYGPTARCGIEAVETLPPEVYDPEQPTVAIYSGRTFTGSQLLGQVAATLKSKDKPAANFISVVPGTYSESFVTEPNTPGMFVQAGYTINSRGNIMLFELAEPIQVNAVDIGESNGFKTPTKAVIDKLGIVCLRPETSFKYDDKFIAKQRLEQAGVTVPKGVLLRNKQLDDLESVAPDGHFVIKPVGAAWGSGVSIFGQEPDRKKLRSAIRELKRYSDDVVIEEYIESLSLQYDGFPEGNSWNLRVIGFNGYCGSYVRINKEGQPVNIARGATVVTTEAVLHNVSKEHGTAFATALSQAIIGCADKVCRAIPDTAIGIDIVVDRQGEPVVIETNIMDFGAFASNAYEKDAHVKAAETMVNNVTITLNNHQKVAKINYSESTPFSIVDRPSFLHSLLATIQGSYVKDHKLDARAFLTDNRESIKELMGLLESQRAAGEDLYSVSALKGILRVALKAKNQKLAEQSRRALVRTMLGTAVLIRE